MVCNRKVHTRAKIDLVILKSQSLCEFVFFFRLANAPWFIVFNYPFDRMLGCCLFFKKLISRTAFSDVTETLARCHFLGPWNVCLTWQRHIQSVFWVPIVNHSRHWSWQTCRYSFLYLIVCTNDVHQRLKIGSHCEPLPGWKLSATGQREDCRTSSFVRVLMGYAKI